MSVLPSGLTEASLRCSAGAAVQLDGRMVDAPVVLRARRVLERLRGSEPE